MPALVSIAKNGAVLIPTLLLLWRRKRAGDARWKRRLEEIEGRLRAEMLNMLPMTPKETCEWINKFLVGLWPSFLDALSADLILPAIQEAVELECPPSIKLNIESFTFGKSPPMITGVQAFAKACNASATGFTNVSHVDAEVAFASDGLEIFVSAKTPVGTFSVRVTSVQLKCVARITPVFPERLLMFSLKESPKIGLDLKIRGPLGVSIEPGDWKFLEYGIKKGIELFIQEPERIPIGLEVQALGKMAIDGNLEMQVVKVEGLAPKHKNVCVQMTALNTRTSPIVSTIDGTASFGKECVYNFQLGGPMVKILVRVLDSAGRKIDKMNVGVLFLMDGGSAFWTTDEADSPVAKRHYGAWPAWEHGFLLHKTGARITLRLKMLDWLYKQQSEVMAPQYRTPGARTVILKVVEAHNLEDKGSGRRVKGSEYRAESTYVSNPMATVSYDGKEYHTSVLKNTLNPMWAETFAFEESVFAHQRRVRVTLHNVPSTTLGKAMKGSSSTTLGFAEFSLDAVSETEMFDRTFPLRGVQRGKLHVAVKIVPGSITADANERGIIEGENLTAALAVAKMEAYVFSTTPHFEVQVHSARGLKAMDANGKSDPYCQVIYGGQKQRTPMVSKTLTPTWDWCARFRFEDGENMNFVVKDYDAITSDDVIGKFIISYAKLIESRAVSGWMKISNHPGDPYAPTTGEILIKIVNRSKHGADAPEEDESADPWGDGEDDDPVLPVDDDEDDDKDTDFEPHLRNSEDVDISDTRSQHSMTSTTADSSRVKKKKSRLRGLFGKKKKDDDEPDASDVSSISGTGPSGSDLQREGSATVRFGTTQSIFRR